MDGAVAVSHPGDEDPVHSLKPLRAHIVAWKQARSGCRQQHTC